MVLLISSKLFLLASNGYISILYLSTVPFLREWDHFAKVQTLLASSSANYTSLIVFKLQVRKEYQRFIDYKPQTSTTHTTSKSANGTAGHGTGSSGLPLTTSKRKSSGFSDANSRKHSGFSDINVGRHGSSSA